jgi:hypothetical protein
VRASAAAAASGPEATAIAARRRGAAGTDQISFTTMRRTIVTSMRQSMVAATTSLPALAALAVTASQAALHALVVTGRERYSERKQKSRPSFPLSAATRTTHAGPVTITRFQPVAGAT